MKKLLLLCAALCVAFTTFTACDTNDESKPEFDVTIFYGKWVGYYVELYTLSTGALLSEDDDITVVFEISENGVVFNGDATTSLKWSYDSESGVGSVYRPGVSELYEVRLIDNTHATFTLCATESDVKQVIYCRKDLDM